jgi:glycosyltransferase involved in cell wall biosynthesis
MTDVGVAGELVRNEETGLVIPTQNEAALADGLLRMLEDASLAARLSQAALEEVGHCITKQETLELYKKSWNAAFTHGTRTYQA